MKHTLCVPLHAEDFPAVQKGKPSSVGQHTAHLGAMSDSEEYDSASGSGSDTGSDSGSDSDAGSVDEGGSVAAPSVIFAVGAGMVQTLSRAQGLVMGAAAAAATSA